MAVTIKVFFLKQALRNHELDWKALIDFVGVLYDLKLITQSVLLMFVHVQVYML